MSLDSDRNKKQFIHLLEITKLKVLRNSVILKKYRRKLLGKLLKCIDGR